MYDLATFYRVLKERMPFIRRELSGEEWAEFRTALQELAPAFIVEDPQALEDATDRAYEVCFRYARVRGQFPMSGAIIGPLRVMAPQEIEDLPQRVHELLSEPDAAARTPTPPEQPAPPRPEPPEGASS
jgi:hypothetical protein